MAKKTSPVNTTIKKKSSNGSGVNAQKPAVKTSSKKHAHAQVKLTGKASPKKRSQKTTASKRISLKQQLAQREAELEIINSVQQGLAAELDFQTIVELVGDKLSEVLHTGDLGIRWYDEKTHLIHHLYEFEHGERLEIPPVQPKPGGVFETMTRTRQPIVMRNEEDYLRWNLPIHPGTDQSKSAVYIPIISSDLVLGFITIENYERENAFSEPELRLLTTIAASLGNALENARLFDETQRLLNETEQRNAELAIINSVQQGLASK
ncbi:MAG TPA: GAF domain-containing protein, partial [Anaerolineales bacterium]|nr:GAF domain-containing protein [Anaerolineales bacterium]